MREPLRKKCPMTSSIRPLSLSLALTLPMMPASSLMAQESATTQPAQGDVASLESEFLSDHVQLTFDTEFVRAGEAYFCPRTQWVIFQAVPVPEEGQPTDPFYSMWVGELDVDADGNLTGLKRTLRISPKGSANTCGYFHPDPRGVGSVIFASTTNPPAPIEGSGFRNNRYRWQFFPEMELVTKRVITIQRGNRGGSLVEDPDNLFALTKITNRLGYDAEASFSPAGRYLVYCTHRGDEQQGDIYIIDTRYNTTTVIVDEAGYDGGPFFSPEGDRLVYRSDRRGDNRLQVFVCHLEFDEEGIPQRFSREYQLTNDDNVNWAPFWHPGGKHIMYTTSAAGHTNYEVFMMDADPGNLDDEEARGPVRYGTNKRRITHATGFDGLPVFNADGTYMMWTSQRTASGEKGSSQLWVAKFNLNDGESAADPTTQP